VVVELSGDKRLVYMWNFEAKEYVVQVLADKQTLEEKRFRRM
jgi:hypothetical protein